MGEGKISIAEGLAMLLLLSTVQATFCPPCSCDPLRESWDWAVNCSSRQLKEMPPLIPNIKILRLQNNHLTTILPGALDNLTKLKEVDFSNNPWHCDCSILYLKMWLEDFDKASLAKVTCTTPAAVQMRPLSQLTGNELEGCRKPLPIKCLDFFWRDFALIFVAIIALILACCILQYSKKLASQAARKLHPSEIPLLRVHDLENQKSK
ncbi:platelet glycoprotein IX-like [Elgaria multicarinata webbii]|uniref:platelet glycoprotein IX-like n=1 Tax=Elgaria multicarinata webbii TaxID=159646 RepID=UPI002FCD630A